MPIRKVFITITLGALIGLFSLVLRAQEKTPQMIMTFNVENLFDTQDDPGKSDETYLPLSKKRAEVHKRKCQKIPRRKWRDRCLHWDWSEKVLQSKLDHLAQVIHSVNRGRGPDLLILQEVENKKVLSRLNEEYLKDLHYKSIVHLEGADQRGIDVAMLSRWKLKEPPQLVPIPFKKMTRKQRKDSRALLQAKFELPLTNETVTVYGAHFPAPFHPVGLRIEALLFLNQILEKRPPETRVIVAGDFNIPKEEEQIYQLSKYYVTPFWIDTRSDCKKCQGTYYYAPKKDWSFLDRILLSKNWAQGKWKYDPESVHVPHSVSEHVTSKNRPRSFDPKTQKGVSDHWPLVIQMR